MFLAEHDAAAADIVVLIGPFGFSFRPDGDDRGVGSVLLNAGDGVRAETAYSVTTAKWEEFIRDLLGELWS